MSDRLRVRAREIHSWLCVGLDPVPERFPAGFSHDAAAVRAFCREIVAATSDFAVCYKINFAFFEAQGSEGWRVLEQVRQDLPSDVPVIADAKRGDIPSTMERYAHSIFDDLGFDAVTLSPYPGWDSLGPFLAYEGKLLFVLAHTSNERSGDLQDLEVDGEPLYLRVAREALSLPGIAEVGLVGGATKLSQLSALRALSETTVILVPGVGAQGAGAREAISAGCSRSGENALINSSRSILYASSGSDFVEAARRATAATALETWSPAVA